MRHKRSRQNKDQDGDIYMNIPPEDHHSEAYIRSHGALHHSESYRTASTSSRGSYVSDRDIPSRSRHDDEWRHADLDHERYHYGDPYSRGDRSDYGDAGPRSTGGWGAVDPPYSSSRHDWPPHYENGSSSSSYAETASWGVAAPSAYESSRAVYADHWQQRDSREAPVDDWPPPDVVRKDQYQDRRQPEWRPEAKREKTSSQKFQSDSGWGSRRRDRGWNRETSAHGDAPAERGDSLEDRAWEPAPSWKSNHNDHPQQHQNQRGQNGQRTNGKSKRGQNQNKQKREWRADDGDLNNWTRRDTSSNKSSGTQHPPAKRKYPRSPSPSRSRSRSPTESYKSHHSSRGRSRSPSFSPASKRRRRDLSPVTLHNRTTSERDVPRSQNRGKRYYSKSPSPSRSVTGRRSSVSNSSGSERSRSPVSRTRSLHRLPPAKHSTTTTAIPSAAAKNSNNGAAPQKNESKNGKSRSRKRERKAQAQALAQAQSQTQAQASRSIQDADYDLLKQAHPRNPLQSSSSSSHPLVPHVNPINPITISMPPPPSIPPNHLPRARHAPPDLTSKGDSFADPRIEVTAAAKPNRSISLKGAGFKPIGKANSAVKKFFPGDEDDVDIVASEVTSTLNVSRVNPPPESSVSTLHTTPQPMDWKADKEEPNPGRWPEIPDPREAAREEAQESVHWRDDRVFDPPTERFAQALPNMTESPLVYHPRAHQVPGSSSMTASDPFEGRSSPTNGAKTNPRSEPVSPPDHNASIGEGPPMSSTKDLYKIISQVGEGTFGKVYKARNTLSGSYVALKRIRMESERDGFPVTAMREIKLLQSLRHENVVRLYEMMVSNGSVYMVFEYMDHDLTGVLSQSQFTFSDAHLKSLCHQMLAGLAYLHHKGVIHRDIKGSNILINNRGELKLADFGLARFYQKRRRADYTNRVITLWYRPPELLFGATVYGPEVDMWSAGCIMLELFTKKPIFQGADEIHQVEVVFRLMGTPTPDRWSDAMNLPWFELVKPQQVMPNRFREAFQKWMSPAALDLAEQLLEYDPMKRITALQAMDAPYFLHEAPSASAPVGLIDLEGEWHELETKRERAKRKDRKNTT